MESGESRMQETRKVDPDKLRRLVAEILRVEGVPIEDAKIVADSLVEADLTNVQSHGVTRIAMYSDSIEKGGTDPKAEIRIICDFPAGAVIDAQKALGIVAGYKAMKLAIEKARQVGVAMVNVRNSNHCGAVGYYTKMAAQEGMLGIACSNAPASMAPWGSRVKYMGTNPFSIGTPTGQEPMVLDMATSVVARGKILLAEKKGTPIPSGWAIDEEGQPTTNPSAALKGCVLPFAGPKGSGISMMIDVISGILSGATYGSHIHNPFSHPEETMETGHSFLAVDIAHFRPYEEFCNDVGQMISEIKSLDRAKGVEEIFVPGEVERRNRTIHTEKGLTLPVAVCQELKCYADRYGIAFDLDFQE